MGGTGVGIRLLQEECPSGTDPLSPEAPIILSIGPLNGIFPVATKTVATFKSPLTGELGESYAGGRLSLAMRFAGHEAIVIRGKAERPSYISINDSKVEIKDATSIWGIDAQTTGVILREHETGVGRRSIIRIGPAGENLRPLCRGGGGHLPALRTAGPWRRLRLEEAQGHGDLRDGAR